MEKLSKIILRERRSGAALGRHPWVFRSMIAKMDSKIKDGEVVSIYGGEDSRWIAYGLYNSKSDICVRLYSWNQDEILDESFFQNRIQKAIELRLQNLKLHKHTDAIRYIHSDGDLLSGLVLDVFAGHGILEFASLALYQRRNFISDFIAKTLQLKSLRLRISETAKKQEGLGDIFDEFKVGNDLGHPIQIQENELVFEVDPSVGQKTGFFLDQRANRFLLRQLSANQKVLDLCCYSGGFSLNAAAGAAAQVIGVDTSSAAIQNAERNAALNSLSPRFHQEDCIRFCQSMKAESFDIVVLDPPKLAPTRSSKEAALKKYYRMNLEALRLLSKGGIFLSFSCSGSVGWWDFERMLSSAARKASKDLQIISKPGADMDHPISLHCPQSEYLKAIIARVF